MQYAQLNSDGAYSHQLASVGNIEWDSTHYCPASALTPDEAKLFRVVPLMETQPPEINSVTQSVIRDGGELVDGQWQYKWKVVELFTTEEERVEALKAHAKSLVPFSVPMMSAELELLDAGLLDDVEALVASLPRTAQIIWRRAQSVERDHPLIAVVQQAKGLTDSEIDQLFIRAAKR